MGSFPLESLGGDAPSEIAAEAAASVQFLIKVGVASTPISDVGTEPLTICAARRRAPDGLAQSAAEIAAAMGRLRFAGERGEVEPDPSK